MVMTLVWSDATSFKQHLEHMRMFRRTHCRDPERGFAQIKNMPTLSNIRPTIRTGGVRGSIAIRGKPAIVPMWEIVLPENSQN